MIENKKVWDEGIKALEALHERRRANPRSKSDVLYWENMLEYFLRIRRAAKKGQPIIFHPLIVPVEIFRAFDLVSATSTFSCTNMSNFIRNQVETLNTSLALGMPLETCSAHRIMLAHVASGWFPKPNLVYDEGGGCDNGTYTVRIANEIFGAPVYYLDQPFRRGEKSVEYVRQQLEGLVQFLEEKTGKKMDWDRLRESLALSARIYQLLESIRERRKAIPCPSDNTVGLQIFLTHWMWGGTEEGVRWFETLDKELAERTAAGGGGEERIRLMDLFYGPGYTGGRVLHWLEAEKGAKFVAEPCWSYRGKWEVDLEKPLESIARKYFHCPPFGVIRGEAEHYIRAAVEDALDYKVDAAVWFVNANCRQNGVIRLIRDALSELSIPTYTIGLDCHDITSISVDEIKDSLELFLASLPSRKLGSATSG